MTDIATALPAAVAEERPADHRTRRLLEAPILPLLIRLAWPNVLIMIAQASTGLIETWWVAKLGTDALAAMALVFPAVMLMTTISAGALGGAISSAVARALGARRQDEANALVLQAVVINVAFGLAFSALFLLAGRPIYHLLGGTGPDLEAALIYSNVVFAGNVFTWLMNGLASVIRGTGNMLYPAIVTCVGVAFLVPVSPVLIFGWGPVPALGIAGGGVALVAFYLLGALAMAWHIWAGRNPVRFQWARLRWRPMASILRIGALSSFNSIQTNVIIAGATALVAAYAGMDAVAGFGTGVRLEYLLIPLVFGIGAPMVAMVGTNMGAGQPGRALKVALAGAGLAFAVTEAIGLGAAFFPDVWLNLFSAEPGMIAAGSAYLRLVGPFYGFFGLGLALYFASQGAGRLLWPLVAGALRVLIALGGGWVALSLGAPLSALFVALGLALLVYGATIFTAVRSGLWLR
ncbi:MATE family efflux transporter [Azorhizobium oxalatiphilum]|uniref:MATE family efflux transporter n=1 Tax=Azorhizobium oxalatiphilum TaxID=980631 RepID=A0A917CE47_9HYPH|nr:MATE family efflux transporter [Azorhizobium oxalatiphilum]GGF85878.1 MATE family efflux transporter [Azorhizobium oxalatiphilum]